MSFLSLRLVSINSRLHHLKHNGINQLGKSLTYLDFLPRLHLAPAPVLSVRSNQRLLPLIQQPLKHPAAPDTLASVHAAQGHQRAAAAWAGFAAWLIAHLPSLRIRSCSVHHVIANASITASK